MKRLVVVGLLSCAAGPDIATTPPSRPPPPPPDDAPLVSVAEPDAAPVSTLEPPPVVVEDPAATWLRGSTHVHSKPSGDSNVPTPDVEAWYEKHGYDFIVLTDHNRVTVSQTTKVIVIPGIELTMNPQRCEPPGDGTCRIHINGLGVTARPEGKLDWPDRSKHDRIELYAKAIETAQGLGTAVVQINHPNWHWGMTPELLAELGRRGAKLVELENVQFTKWNAGDQDHPSTEAEWDAVLNAGITMWGVASDDAHDYQADGRGKYPAGGGWVVVKARRNPQAILDALAAGKFYSSTGVSLTRADVDHDELVVEVASEPTRTYTITFIENGTPVATVNGLVARRALPSKGYVRAVITRDDGKKAWVQPVRRGN
ncbi:MAG TPA: CehA/McbA family metallohydrolase [Kofleriaceae bacterium]|nr:CehA/McbA family metallohydrolase [Kofleriaceae bacterium]